VCPSDQHDGVEGAAMAMVSMRVAKATMRDSGRWSPGGVPAEKPGRRRLGFLWGVLSEWLLEVHQAVVKVLIDQGAHGAGDRVDPVGTA
jgi:hypothetical protein